MMSFYPQIRIICLLWMGKCAKYVHHGNSNYTYLFQNIQGKSSRTISLNTNYDHSTLEKQLRESLNTRASVWH